MQGERGRLTVLWCGIILPSTYVFGKRKQATAVASILLAPTAACKRLFSSMGQGESSLCGSLTTEERHKRNQQTLIGL